MYIMRDIYIYFIESNIDVYNKVYCLNVFESDNANLLLG